MATVRLERIIAAPPQEVFDVVTDSNSLKLASLVLRVKRVREGRNGGWSAGAVREVVAAGAWFREEITTNDRPHLFAYQILKSVPPITHFGGTIEVTPEAGGSRVVWESSYDIPLLAGGKATAVVTKRILELAFGQILAEADKKLTAGANR
ncbi:SRPBCC family protein [Antrihabitans sp. YC2-6]|uniref:SRPBCC family protein n=1 Tax=Antrihabitans sp. YC2-6 TaxID=2799498 RepID=UPI0018F59923|nr:SRPBCC family protein [Antrihabitans sp. YC2-6]MBJ8344642.1 SRPBCC family protein [Antrihabitans sp. YC2-6]